ncbi:Uncharacterised protein [Legionella steigerwaltii]|uniref:Uncharacterized protein n=1 Tax=Legionella steigerwaltii TaxID=460 RepID=A0A378LF14_9GAMM|nr:hypothetical protein [Legionella steigerwaltii]KTD77799.1 hypothetical protein Lstg_1522 [Legionella steigerwaltii]STY24438.1 Uncharacterised protein [Legionella steigerwaltii]
MAKYRYVIVCGWATRDENGKPSYSQGHSGLLLVTSEEPLVEDSFPAALKEVNGRLEYIVRDSIQIEAYVATAGTPVESLEFDLRMFSPAGVEEAAPEFCVLPEKIGNSPGIDYDRIKEWWETKRKRLGAGMFQAIDDQDIINKDGINPEKQQIIEEYLAKRDYVLVRRKVDPPEFFLVYKDTQHATKIHSITGPDLNTLIKHEKHIKWRADNGEFSISGINRNEPLRKIILSIAHKIPSHVPNTLDDYSRYTNNCSHVVREGLQAGEVRNFAKFLSTPAGVMSDTYKIMGKYTSTLRQFLIYSLQRMEKEDVYKTKKHDTKIEKFKGLVERLANGCEDKKKLLQEIELAAKEHRGYFAIGDSETYKQFKQLVKRTKELDEERRDEEETDETGGTEHPNSQHGC